MVHVLIVDDEVLLAESVRSEVDWDALGVQSVQTAYNIRQAKERFEQGDVDVMLCDIEMPQGSGLELLQWVNERYPATKSIFLTCHADFKYAQRAMQLGSFDYLLKPIFPEDIGAAVGKAIEKINEDSKLQQYSRLGQYWVQHQPLIVERFWLDVVRRTIPPGPDAVRKAAEERNLPFDPGMRFTAVLISIQRFHKQLSVRDTKIIEFALKKSGEETVFSGMEASGPIVTLTDRWMLAVVPAFGTGGGSKQELEERCKAYIGCCNTYFYCDVSVYVGRSAFAHELPDEVGRLMETDRNNVACTNKVFAAQPQGDAAGEKVLLPDMNAWEQLLKDGKPEQVVNEAEAFLYGLIGREGTTAQTLHQFHHDVLQMTYYVLKLKGIQAHRLFQDSESQELSERASRSVADAIDWLRHMFAKATQYVGAVQQPHGIVEKVANYIRSRIDEEEVSREDAAGHVFLHPDYLDRLFKRETGQSVTEYVVNLRMTTAQELLLHSDLSVGAVAARVGYTNLSHFSRRFRKFSGLSPNEFRQKHARSPKP